MCQQEMSRRNCLPKVPSDRSIRGCLICKRWIIGARYTNVLPVPVAAFTSLHHFLKLRPSNWTNRKHVCYNRTNNEIETDIYFYWKITIEGYAWRPEMATGIASAWIFVGFWKPILSNPIKQHNQPLKLHLYTNNGTNYWIKSNSVQNLVNVRTT